MDGKPLDIRNLESGQLVLVHLGVEAKVRAPDALVIDLLPAGLEPENQNLGQSAASLQDASSEVRQWQEAMQNAAIKHQEFRDDRYVAAVDINEYDRTHLLYLARAVTPAATTCRRPRWSPCTARNGRPWGCAGGDGDQGPLKRFQQARVREGDGQVPSFPRTRRLFTGWVERSETHHQAASQRPVARSHFGALILVVPSTLHRARRLLRRRWVALLLPWRCSGAPTGCSRCPCRRMTGRGWCWPRTARRCGASPMPRACGATRSRRSRSRPITWKRCSPTRIAGSTVTRGQPAGPGACGLAEPRRWARAVRRQHPVDAGGAPARPAPAHLAGKLRQLWRTLQLEWHLSKDEILTLYLDRAPFGGTLRAAASWTYLGKPPSKLTRAEAALRGTAPGTEPAAPGPLPAARHRRPGQGAAPTRRIRCMAPGGGGRGAGGAGAAGAAPGAASRACWRAASTAPAARS